jgi:hypothetical protein
MMMEAPWSTNALRTSFVGLVGIWLIWTIVAVTAAKVENTSCVFGSPDSGIYGQLSPAELLLQNTFLESRCGRHPSMNERELYYNPLKTGELNQSELLVDLNAVCDSKDSVGSQFSQRYPWKDRFPDKIYTWTVDFHPAPSACNIAIYNDIGVVIHPEIDHPPFCHFNGFCRNRMDKIFGLGGFMAGFSLDPDHTVLKREFYNVYKDDPEFQRIDVFMCSHPLANCELFEHFHKPMIIFATTRYEFGRNDVKIPWRVREISHWNAWGELVERQRNLTKFVHLNHKTGLLALTANSMYDVEYLYYFTGIRPVYIPSWCGDADASYGMRSKWLGCQLSVDDIHQPTHNLTVIVPFKRHHIPTAMLDGLTEAKKNYSIVFHEDPPVVEHSADVIVKHDPEVYKSYKAVIHIPYQASTMSFFELYRQNIPIFAPSLKLLIEWHQRYDILGGRVYGNPARDVDLIKAYTGLSDEVLMNIPNPNAETVETYRYWFALSDFYVMKHIILFDSWSHLLELLSSGGAGIDLHRVSVQMAAQNIIDKQEISLKWDQVFKQVVPHRNRTRYSAHLYT